MFGIGSQELMFIFLIVLLIFGGKKIPEMARGLGKGIREFKNAKDGVERELEDEPKKVNVPAPQPKPSSGGTPGALR